MVVLLVTRHSTILWTGVLLYGTYALFLLCVSHNTNICFFFFFFLNVEKSIQGSSQNKRQYSCDSRLSLFPGRFFLTSKYYLFCGTVLLTLYRTLLIKDGIAYGQAGAGIVYDSDPLSEYKETMTKMMGGLRAVFRAEAYGGVKVLHLLLF
jgi:hypothetical protein